MLWLQLRTSGDYRGSILVLNACVDTFVGTLVGVIVETFVDAFVGAFVNTRLLIHVFKRFRNTFLGAFTTTMNLARPRVFHMILFSAHVCKRL